MSLRAIAGAGCACAVVGSALADPIQIYQNDFESGVVGQEWSANTQIEYAPPFTRFAGRYAGNEGITLTLPTIAEPLGDGVITPPDQDGSAGDGGGGGGDPIDPFLQYTLTFDLIVIDSWDGSSEAYGPDSFRVVVNDGIVFEETIANQHENQTMREPDVGRTQLYYAIHNDSIYRDVSVSFTLPAEDELMAIMFRGVDLQSLSDESWGIDNVRVSYDLVPSPGAGAMALLGMGMLARRRRRAS